MIVGLIIVAVALHPRDGYMCTQIACGHSLKVVFNPPFDSNVGYNGTVWGVFDGNERSMVNFVCNNDGKQKTPPTSSSSSFDGEDGSCACVVAMKRSEHKRGR